MTRHLYAFESIVLISLLQFQHFYLQQKLSSTLYLARLCFN
ncbi:hypothetical protein SynROS8604_00889 [Synechococcus sp. ROS8604]|nr:hypothetical protein SynROS8604_00889 [Synechococcus sp. ROS8604]